MFGHPDYVLRVAVADHAAYEAFLTRKLIGLPGVLHGFSSAVRSCPCSATGCLTLFTVTVAWFAGLQKENASAVAVRLLGK